MSNMNAQLNTQDFGLRNMQKILDFSSVDTFIKIENLRGKKIIFTPDDKFLVPSGGWGSSNPIYDSIVINQIHPSNESCMVAGVDSSCIKIGETEDGILYAAKCGIAISMSSQIVMHFRIGPVIFYLTEGTLQNSDLDRRLVKVLLFDVDTAKRMIRTNIERSVQYELSKILQNSIILVDGSLKSSQYESRYCNYAKVLENCALRSNSLVGLSKCSKLKILDKVSQNLRTFKNPGTMDVSFIIKSMVKNSIGNNTLIKLSSNGLIFRADVVSGFNKDYVATFGILLGNDSAPSGYPECLRLAHHVSCFSTTEVSGLRGHIINNYDVKELYTEDVRRNILGLF